MKVLGKTLFIMIAIVAILFFTSLLFEMEEVIYFLPLIYLIQVPLALYYLFISKLSHYFIAIICFLVLPIGILLKVLHWPYGDILSSIGLFSYFASGVLILFDKRKGEKIQVEWYVLSITSMLITITYFIPFPLHISHYLYLILTISSGYIYIKRKSTSDYRKLQLAKLIGVSSLPSTITYFSILIKDFF